MFNKVILAGRLCATPEMRQTQSGTSVCGFRMAVDRRSKNKQTGERETDFINCSAFGQTAEFVSKYFAKGSAIIIDGELHNHNYEDKNGTKHYGMDIMVSNVSFCGSKSDNAQQGTYDAAQSTVQSYHTNYQQTAAVPYSEPQSVREHSYKQDVQSQIGDMSGFEDILSDGTVPF